MLCFGGPGAPWAAAAADNAELLPADLSPETRELLRSEMREITRAMEELVSAVVEARWETVAETAQQIADSFVLKQELGDLQRQELNRLPERFRQLDRKFHDQARTLSQAAAERDPQRMSYQYYQLLSSCTSCHAEYAREAFPGFVAPSKSAH